jgi:hypothetical protein
MSLKLASTLALAMFLSVEANAATIFQSVPVVSDATLNSNLGGGSGWCSPCSNEQMVDYFSLSSNADIKSIDFAGVVDAPYNGLSGLTIGFWTVDGARTPTTLISNQFVTPTAGASVGVGYQMLTAALSTISLTAGDYAISFYATFLALPSYSGGDPSTSGRQYNTGQDTFGPGFGSIPDHLAFTLKDTVSTVPVPAALPLLLSAIAGVFGLSRRRRQNAKTA